MIFSESLCLLAIVLTVSANQPITIQSYPIYQQDVCSNIPGHVPVILRTSNNNLYTQPNTAHNQIPTDVANVLVNRVLSNPTIHRLLDPNTRFYNQNGVEVQKTVYNGRAVPQVYNGAAVPNVINNYFIVSPEYLKLNTTDVIKSEERQNPVNGEIANQIIETTPGNVDKNVIKTIINKPHTKSGKKKKATKSNRHKNLKSSIKPREQINTRIAGKDNDTKSNIQTQGASKPRKVKSNTTKKQLLELPAKLNEFKDNSTPKQRKTVSNNDKEQFNGSEKQHSKSKSTANTRNKIYDINAESHNTNFYEDMSILDVLLKGQKQNVESKTLDTKAINENEVDIHNIKEYQNGQTQLESVEQQILNSNIGSVDNRFPRNSKEEAIIKDFSQKFPNVPESLARSMLSYIQGQFQNQFGHNFFYPFSYDQYFQMPQYSNIGRCADIKGKSRSRRRKQKHRRRNNNKKRNGHKNKSAALKSSDTIAQVTSKMTEKETAVFDHSLTDPPGIEPEIIQKFELSSGEQSAEEIQTTIENTPTDLYFSSYELLTELPVESTTKLDEIEEFLEDIDIAEIKLEQDIDYNAEDTTVYNLGQEDTVPIIYDNTLIEDYYPIFTDNAGFIENDNEYYVKNLNDRYYYTTDKNSELNWSIDKRKPAITFKEDIKMPDRIYKESLPRILKYSFRDQIHPRHTYFDADRESLKNIDKEPYQIPRPSVPQVENLETAMKPLHNEEMEFKAPPGLEFPDFITRKIDKDVLKSNHKHDVDFEDAVSHFDDEDKSSIYSDFKTPMYNNRIKPNAEIRRVKIPSRAKGSNIETVFANSKVAKYGPGAEESLEDTASKYPDGSEN